MNHITQPKIFLKIIAFQNSSSLTEVTNISEVHTATIIVVIIALMMEAVYTSETSVYFCQIAQHHTHCRENLKSHKIFFLAIW
jgi:hypothetical protein